VQNEEHEETQPTQREIAEKARHVEQQRGVQKWHQLRPVELTQDVPVLVRDVFGSWPSLEAAGARLLGNVPLIELQVGSLRKSHQWLLVISIVKAVIIINWLLLVATLSGYSSSEGGNSRFFIIRTTFINARYGN
jgi:hypothetical protein